MYTIPWISVCTTGITKGSRRRQYYRAQCLHKPWRKLFVEQPCGEVR